MKIFSDSNSEFQILDYSPSHNQLLLRSMRNKEKDYNIDIIFKGVLYMSVPTKIKGIEISLFQPSDDSYKLTVNYMKSNKDYKIFSVRDSESRIYLVNAMCVGIYNNKIDILESSIGRYDIENFGEKVLWYAD